MNSIKVPVTVTWMILASGALLMIATILLCFMTYRVGQEIEENRRIGCISRALDNQAYAPQCEEYLHGQE